MKFHNFHGPILFSRTFQLLENGHFFQELSRPEATLSIVAALLVHIVLLLVALTVDGCCCNSK